MERLSFIKLVKCPVCGKEFLYNSSTVYKLPSKTGMVQYCSYTCFRKCEKEREEKKMNRNSIYNKYRGLK